MDSLIDALEKNQCRGVVYHYPNLLMGDYDSLSSQQEILHLLLMDRRPYKRRHFLCNHSYRGLTV